MKNTIVVRGGGKGKGGKLHGKRGKGIRNAYFWVINSKKFRGGSSEPAVPERKKTRKRPYKCINDRNAQYIIKSVILKRK